MNYSCTVITNSWCDSRKYFPATTNVCLPFRIWYALALHSTCGGSQFERHQRKRLQRTTCFDVRWTIRSTPNAPTRTALSLSIKSYPTLSSKPYYSVPGMPRPIKTLWAKFSSIRKSPPAGISPTALPRSYYSYATPFFFVRSSVHMVNSATLSHKTRLATLVRLWVPFDARALATLQCFRVDVVKCHKNVPNI